MDPLAQTEQVRPSDSPLPEALFQRITQLFSSVQTAPDVVDMLLEFSAGASVSDLLLEPGEEISRVRVRLDGVLRTCILVPNDMFHAMTARVKVLAQADSGNLRAATTEGKFRFNYNAKPVTVRVALAQVVGGELCAMRLHDSTSMERSLRDLGIQEPYVSQFEKIITAKNGLIMVCGPTGAGKTATLYSSLQLLNDGKTNLISIEDPIEYVIAGVNQMEVNAEHGLSFANGLRVSLRLNPDVMLVGEVRDQETAKISIESALTGHLVLTTLHANSAVSAISRLKDLEIENFFIAAALKCVVCQRLIRKTCEHCGAWRLPTTEEAAAYQQITGTALAQQFAGVGCEVCSGSGYHGRLALYEIAFINDAIRQLILSAKSEQEILAGLRQQGFRTVLEDGLAKVTAGQTTLIEVLTGCYSGA
jgi:type IV pilus assembly protein PilB